VKPTNRVLAPLVGLSLRQFMRWRRHGVPRPLPRESLVRWTQRARAWIAEHRLPPGPRPGWAATAELERFLGAPSDGGTPFSPAMLKALRWPDDAGADSAPRGSATNEGNGAALAIDTSSTTAAPSPRGSE
jgi:hypothetical protein